MITFFFTVARPSVTVKADGELSSGITVLTGQSGSGKSTFIKCIAGLVKPTTGSIQCDETTWVDRDKKLWVPAQERQVGYMPQGNIVFPHLSVEHNITYSKRGTPEMCDTLLQRLGLEKYRKTKAGSLSGGEQQRVILARALAQRTECLVLDEPTNHLDIKYQLELMTIVKRLDATVVSAIHDLNLAAIYCDRLIALKDGSVVCTGTPQEVLTEDTIRHIYGVSATVQTLPNGRLNIIYNME